MIDLHTHTILSDGVLLPSELVRRAHVNGLSAIAITDHVDHSNIEPVLAGLVRVSEILNRYWGILVLPGVEITHVPLEVITDLVVLARQKGAKVVVVHGESTVEPVIKGTNRVAIESGADILAHPGQITEEDVRLAVDSDIHLEITTRNGHNKTNKHVFDMAIKHGAKMVLDTDSHLPNDMLTKELFEKTLKDLGASDEMEKAIAENSQKIVNKFII